MLEGRHTDARHAADALYELLRARGVQLDVDGDRLRVTAAAGTLDSDLQADIRRWKPELIARVARDRVARGAVVAGRELGAVPGVDQEVRLTPAQERLWLFQQLDPASTTYNLSPVVRIDGVLDVPRLERALEGVIRRHEPLHSVVGAGHHGGTILTRPDATLVLNVVDLAHLGANAQATAVAEVVRHEQGRAFDLTADLPIRATLIRRGTAVHDLVTTMQHIAVDGVSLQHFYRDLAALYAGTEPAPLRTTYRAFARRQRDFWTPERLAQRGEFWRQRLAGAPDELELPSDRARGASASYSGRVVMRTLDATAFAALMSLAQSERASLFMGMLAAYATVLHRHSGQRDLVVGTPLHGRDQSEVSDLVGMFVNQLPLRMTVARRASFRDLLRSARESALGSMTDHEMPFGALVDAIGAPRDSAKNPVFQALLNVAPPMMGADGLSAAGVTFAIPALHDMIALFDGQAKFDLTLYAVPSISGLDLALVFNADLYDEARMSAMLDDVDAVLRHGVASPDTALDTLRLATPSGGAGPWPSMLRRAGEGLEAQSVPEHVARVAAQWPERTAVIGAGRSLTYAALHDDAGRIARLVASVTADDPSQVVGVLVPHGDESIPALLGLLRSGCAYVPLDPTYPEARLAFMIADAGVRVVLTTPPLHDRAVQLLPASGVVIETSAVAPEGAALPPLPAPDATAYLLYTSGSSGQPKAVVQSHRNLLVQAGRYAGALSLTAGDRLAWLASISFDASLMDVFGGLVGGAAICPIDPRAIDLSTLPQRLEAAQLNVLHVTPTVLRTLARATVAPTFPTIRAVVLGGEAVRADDVAFFDARFAPDALLSNLYGASEHSFSLGYAIDRRSRSREVPIGWPVGDTDVLLLDDSGQPDPVIGEMALRSAHGALRYWNAPEHSARAFVADPEHPDRVVYRTGDIVRRRPDGAYVFVRRADNQLKVRGHRVEAAEVESVLLAHPALFEVAVHAPVDATGERVLTGCLVMRAGAPAIETGELTRWLAERLPTYMVPTGWAILDRLPRTPSGKIDRRALPSADTSVHASSAGLSARTADEQEILGIWRDVLAVSDVDVYDDFFAIGGHSLTATQVVARVREVFDVELPLRQFFDHPTVAHTAAWVRDHREIGASVPPLISGPLQERMPLSFSQERLWFLQQLDRTSTAYNMSVAVQLDGPLDVERFRHALDAVAMRQESLRTRFVTLHGQPAQVVSPTPIHRFELHDLAGPDSGSEADRLARALSLAESVVLDAYDLERDPLCRVVVIRLAPSRHLLAVGMHHTISDMWSYGVLARDLRAAYGGETVDLPPTAVTCRDYARWQRDWLQGEALGAQVDYWRRQLDGVTTLEMPTDFPRPAFFTFDGDTVRVPLPPALRERVRLLAVAQRATPFMVMLAAFKTLLAAYSRQSDIAVGVPIAGRGSTATQDLIGTFVNTLVHRNDLSNDPSFRELITRVRTTALDAFAHQDAPFEVLVRELQLTRDTSRSPLFQVLFNVANTRAEAAPLGDLVATYVPLQRVAAQFDLTLNVGLNEMQSDVTLTFNTSLFARPTAERLLSQFITLLEQAAESPDLPLSALQRAATIDQRQQLDEWNATARPIEPSVSLLSLVDERVRRHADRTAVESPTGSFTYAELQDYARRVTGALRALGVRPGDRVAIVMQRSREMLGALLGVLGAGATYVPVDPTYPAARVRFMLDDAGVSVLVTHRGLEQQHPVDVPVLDLDRWTPPPPVAFSETHPDATAYVIYTSGSTGTPKGVAVTHRGVTNFLCAMRAQPGMHADDALLAVTTISFDIAVLELYLPLVAGGRVVIAGENEVGDGRQLIKRIEEAGISVMQATPATWKLMLAAGWRGSPSLRVLCGGEGLPSSLAVSLIDRTAELWNMYGPTETTVWSTVDRVEKGAPILIGRPIANTTLYVLGERQELLPIGVPGELYIGGAGVAAGYVNRPELTADRFIDSPFQPGERLYRTGDLVRYRHDGRVEHLGRLDSQVKVRGFRIELGEVESALRKYAGVRDAVVTAGNDRLIGYVVLEPDVHATGSELRSSVALQLPPQMVPAFIVALDRLPLTPNGKVDRSRLPDPSGEVSGSSEREAPTTPMELAIADVWASLLQLDHVGATDNFFEIGGHSLLAMEAVALIEERTGVRLEPRSLFFRNLRELAATDPAMDPAAVARP